MAHILDTEIKYLPGIGPKRAELLGKELGIFTFRDMLYFFPFRYIDRKLAMNGLYPNAIIEAVSVYPSVGSFWTDTWVSVV